MGPGGWFPSSSGETILTGGSVDVARAGPGEGCLEGPLTLPGERGRGVVAKDAKPPFTDPLPLPGLEEPGVPLICRSEDEVVLLGGRCPLCETAFLTRLEVGESVFLGSSKTILGALVPANPPLLVCTSSGF